MQNQRKLKKAENDRNFFSMRRKKNSVVFTGFVVQIQHLWLKEVVIKDDDDDVEGAGHKGFQDTYLQKKNRMRMHQFY